jgi:hypothetical protein
MVTAALMYFNPISKKLGNVVSINDAGAKWISDKIGAKRPDNVW